MNTRDIFSGSGVYHVVVVYWYLTSKTIQVLSHGLGNGPRLSELNLKGSRIAAFTKVSK